ncbi:MAG: peptidase, partial [Alphaproteobacteria bacterium]|nr:peptidase [Alphaproteobacteria bacterium]
MNETAFFDLAERLNAQLRGAERLFQRLGSERSTFVRLNRNRVRQAGTVERAALDLTLIDGGRQIDGSCELSGQADDDAARAGMLLERLRERLPHLPEDPYLHFSEQAEESWHDRPAALPDADEAVGTIADLADGLDLVGIWAAGSVAEGLASSIGHRHWHRSESFNLDWSCFLEADKAVKARYGGFDWQPAALAERLGAQREELAVMARPAQRIEPGRYRAFLAPAALEELMDLLAWGGFGLRDHRTRQSPLQRLADGEVRLHPAFSVSEETGRGLSPGFTAEGFRIPGRVALIEQGRFGHCLADARSAKEYGETVNAAAEWPESI